MSITLRNQEKDKPATARYVVWRTSTRSVRRASGFVLVGHRSKGLP